MANKKDDTLHKGLYRKYHYKHNKPSIDMDYVEDLNETDKEWLSNFLDNYYGGRYKKDDSKNPIKGAQARKDTYNSSDARKRDISTYYGDRCVEFVSNESEQLIFEIVQLRQYLKGLDPYTVEFQQYAEMLQEMEATAEQSAVVLEEEEWN